MIIEFYVNTFFVCRFSKFKMTPPSSKLHMQATKPGKLQTVRQRLCPPGWTCRECVKIAELSSATQETYSSSSTWCAHSYYGWMMSSDRWTLLRNQGINKYTCIPIVYFTTQRTNFFQKQSMIKTFSDRKIYWNSDLSSARSLDITF